MKMDTQILKELVTMTGAVKENTMTVYQDEDGWRIEYLDPSHIQTMRLRIPSDKMEGYEPGEAFGMSTEKLAKALNVCGDTVEIKVGSGIAMCSGRVRMTIPKYDIGEAVKWPPLEDFTSSCVVSSDVLRAMSDASPDEADSVSIAISDAGLSLASTNDTATASAVIDVPDGEGAVCQGDATGRYAWLAIRTFLKGLPKGTELNIDMAINYPLSVTFVTGAGLRGEWLLAPWIVEE